MILVFNCGSQSIKWKLFDANLGCLEEGNTNVKNAKNYDKAISEEILKIEKIVRIPEAIKMVGHRVVHGGGVFIEPIKITRDNIKILSGFSKMAPLHNPYNLLGIKASLKVFSRAKQYAVFDTEFFADLPEISKTYPLPEKITKSYKIRRFGFHGISHEYSAKEGAKSAKMQLDFIKVITCHMGGGTSLSAIKNGKPIDTSMGFTPLEGPVMMTRFGSIDPGLVFYLLQRKKDLQNILNKESGIKAICGQSGMLEVLEQVQKGNKKAIFALEFYVNSIKKYIGSYVAILGGCDLLVFTGAIGYGSSKIVNMILDNMPMLKNIKVAFVKPDEELAIAQKIINS
jgi:acetate kinase